MGHGSLQIKENIIDRADAWILECSNTECGAKISITKRNDQEWQILGGTAKKSVLMETKDDKFCWLLPISIRCLNCNLMMMEGSMIEIWKDLLEKESICELLCFNNKCQSKICLTKKSDNWLIDGGLQVESLVDGHKQHLYRCCYDFQCLTCNRVVHSGSRIQMLEINFDGVYIGSFNCPHLYCEGRIQLYYGEDGVVSAIGANAVKRLPLFEPGRVELTCGESCPDSNDIYHLKESLRRNNRWFIRRGL